MRFITLLIWILNFLPIALWAQEKVQIATGEFPPYTSSTEQTNNTVNQIIEEAFATQGISTEFHSFPWVRAYEESKSGRYIATSFWYQDDKHLPYFNPSPTLVTLTNRWFRLKQDAPWPTIQIAIEKRMKVGLTRGYTYTSELWEVANKRKDVFLVFTSDEHNLRMLLAGRIDLFPTEVPFARHVLNTVFTEQQRNLLESSPTPLATNSTHLLFSKAFSGSEIMLEKFNNGMAELERSGRLKALQDKFPAEF